MAELLKQLPSILHWATCVCQDHTERERGCIGTWLFPELSATFYGKSRDGAGQREVSPYLARPGAQRSPASPPGTGSSGLCPVHQSEGHEQLKVKIRHHTDHWVGK